MITLLAEALMSYIPDDRIPSMQEYAQVLDVSVGTVQSAVNALQVSGVVKLENRGRLGAFIADINYGELWALAHNRAMVGILPLPFSRRLEGLATGMRQQFNTQPFSLELRFIRGATTRLQKLQSHQCDWTVVSRYVAENAAVHGFDVQVLALLGEETYTVEHVLVTLGADTLTDGMRIGIDPNSTDHAYIVRMASRGKQVEFVEMDYSQGLELLEQGAIDATIWTRDDVPPTTKHVRVNPLQQMGDRNFALFGEAAIVTQPDNRSIQNVLTALLDVAAIRQTQESVLQRLQLPSY
ncbi:MAG: GntR family transcriptional regulator YhfZ [Anaerolineae bacterium]